MREVFAAPQHPYTKRLLDSLPVIGGSRELAPPIPGGPPDPGELPEGCRFTPRCPYAADDVPRGPGAARGAPGRSRPPATSRPGPSGRRWPRPPSRGRPDDRVADGGARPRACTSARTGRVARAVDGDLARVAARRDPRRGRRVGLRQVHARAGAARAGPARRPGAVASDGARRGRQGGAARAAPARADDLPGPLPDAQPAPAGVDDRGRAAARPGRARAATTTRACAARWRTSGSTRSASSTATRTSSPAGSASAWRSPPRWCSSRTG